MAVAFNGSTGKYSRTTGMPSATSFTVCGWFYMVSDTTCIFADLCSATDVVAGLAWISGSTFELWSTTGSGGTINSSAFGSRPAAGTWNFFYFQCSGTGANLLTGGWCSVTGTSFTTTTTTLASASFTVASLILGSDVFSDWAPARLQNVMVFDAVLTNDELLQQKMALRPQRWANLNSWYPMFDSTLANNVKDYSGNGRDLTSAGTVTIADPPPISYGAVPVTMFSIVTGTTYNQSVLASSQPTNALVRQAGKLQLTTNTPTKSIVRAVGKNILATTTPTKALNRQTTKTLLTASTLAASLATMRVLLKSVLAATTPVAALVRSAGKPLLTVNSALVSLVKAAAKTLSATTTPTKSLSSLKVRLLSLLASTTPVASVSRSIGKFLRAATSALAQFSSVGGSTGPVAAYPWRPPTFYVPPYGFGPVGMFEYPIWDDQLPATTTWTAATRPTTTWSTPTRPTTVWRS